MSPLVYREDVAQYTTDPSCSATYDTILRYLQIGTTALASVRPGTAIHWTEPTNTFDIGQIFNNNYLIVLNYCLSSLTNNKNEYSVRYI